LVIFATVGSAYTTFLIFGGGNGPGSGGGGSSIGDVSSSPAKRELGPTFSAGEFTVNLSSPGVQTRFVRTGIVVEVSEKSALAEVEQREPQIRDRIITILRSRHIDQIGTPEGVALLRTEIMESINELLIRGEIVDVFFIDLVIQ